MTGITAKSDNLRAGRHPQQTGIEQVQLKASIIGGGVEGKFRTAANHDLVDETRFLQPCNRALQRRAARTRFQDPPKYELAETP